MILSTIDGLVFLNNEYEAKSLQNNGKFFILNKQFIKLFCSYNRNIEPKQ